MRTKLNWRWLIFGGKRSDPKGRKACLTVVPFGSNKAWNWSWLRFRQLAVNASPEVSVHWEKAVIRLVDLLQTFPELGRVRHDLQPDGIRTFVVNEFPNYLVFYRLTSREIFFLRVRYGGMDLTNLLILKNESSPRHARRLHAVFASRLYLGFSP